MAGWAGHARLAQSAPGATDVYGESHTDEPYFSADIGPDGTIPTYYYNFQDHYGDIANMPMHNLITDAQEECVRDVFSILTQYFGVQFVESADDGLTIATGDLRVFDPNTISGPGSYASEIGSDPLTRPDADPSHWADNSAYNLIVVNNYYGATDWKNCEFGGEYMQQVMSDIMTPWAWDNPTTRRQALPS